MMVVDTQHEFGDVVYIKHDPEQREFMVTAITVRPGVIVYELSAGQTTLWLQSFEITNTKTIK